MDSRDAVIEKLKAQLDEWNADIAQMEARARQASADKQIALNAQLDGLRKHRDDAQQRLAQFQQASGNAWDEMKVGIEEAWTRIGMAFMKARAQFDETKAA